MSHGTFVWNELMTDDVDKAKAFFAATIGWSFERRDLTDTPYWVCRENGKPVGGITDMRGVSPPGAPPHWFSYIEVDDVDSRVAKIEANGGKILRPPHDIPSVGRIAIVADSTGGAVGWMTSQSR